MGRSYSCDQDDAKDCFERNAFTSNQFAEGPTDCNSPAIKNRTIEVVCYKLVFNPGVALGASYGTFKVVMASINAATAVMLMTKAKNITKIRICVTVISLAVILTFWAIRFTSLNVYISSDVLIYTIQLTIFNNYSPKWR